MSESFMRLGDKDSSALAKVTRRRAGLDESVAWLEMRDLGRSLTSLRTLWTNAPPPERHMRTSHFRADTPARISCREPSFSLARYTGERVTLGDKTFQPGTMFVAWGRGDEAGICDRLPGGGTVECGHYPADERPVETAAAIMYCLA